MDLAAQLEHPDKRFSDCCMKLAIISHTEHFIDSDGCVVGWGPTVREINHLAPHFEKVYHVACLHKGAPPPSSLKYAGENIEFIPISPSGGETLLEKMTVLIAMPEVTRIVIKVLQKVDYFQLRLPTGFGNYLLPWLKIFRPEAKLWVKYAGNWAQKNPPLGYAFQRWFLKRNFLNCKVTINGRWPDQPEHVLSFENPCLTANERIEGEKVLQVKNYGGNLDFVFVGQLTESKGVGRIIEAFRQIKDERREGMLHLVGDGPNRVKYEKLAKAAGINCKFYGLLPREEVNKVLIKSHVLLLPSESEGFPKVIAEGANYGCIPIVSAVSCIPQYVINNLNGFLIASPVNQNLLRCLNRIISLKEEDLAQMAHNAYNLSSQFTYTYYNKRISTELIRLLNE